MVAQPLTTLMCRQGKYWVEGGGWAGSFWILKAAKTGSVPCGVWRSYDGVATSTPFFITELLHTQMTGAVPNDRACLDLVHGMGCARAFKVASY